MANKYDLRIVQRTIGAGDTVVNILDDVPAGKTRFICAVKISLTAAGPIKIATDAKATPQTATEVVDVTELAAAGVVMFPDSVDVNNPLFSIAEGHALNIDTTGAAAGNITFIYFDE